MLTRLFIYFAYILKRSLRYRRMKQFFYDLLENSDSPFKSYFDMFMICLVMTSVFLLIYEVNSELNEVDIWFERGIIALFVWEYLLRVWLCNDSHKIFLDYYEKTRYLTIPFRLREGLWLVFRQKLAYMLTPLALIDLLAIISIYRPLQILRIFLIFRLLKLFRYFNNIKLFADVLASKRFELYTLLIFLGFLIFIGTISIYLLEHRDNGKQIGDLFDALYFTIVTVATVGFGDISPKTGGGRLVAIAMIFSGIGVLAFFTSIIVAALSEKVQELRDQKTHTELNRYSNFVIICGFGRVGQHIATQLEKDKQHFVIIDNNEERILKAKRRGYLAIHADASRNKILKSAGINNKATAVLCTTGSDVINVYITLTSRHLNPTIRIISRANHQENIKKLYQAGANDVLQPFEIAGLVVAEYIGQPVAFEAILGIINEEKNFIMEALCVNAGCFIDGTRLADIDFEQRKLMLVGIISTHALHRNHKNRYPIKDQHFYFNPAKYFELQANDLLVLLGKEVSINYFRHQIESSTPRRRVKL
ncbi:MAG: TrkA-N domain-containing protein [Methylococcaceae bacterium NSP1-2]|nr:NAD-binding protein [Methylococcaceae bacterium]MDD1615366.1 NAD-binding protein [Methylococcaceae bacterium]OYV20541.1 MAG: TrkA-N domain-containing protein [Methylococcaceae bacterium NSP1-2]